MIIIEDSTSIVTVKCSSVIKTLLLYLSLCLKCKIRYCLLFIYIQILSYYKLFLYFSLCLKCKIRYCLLFIYIQILSYYKLFLYFSVCLSVKLDIVSCSFTSRSFLTNVFNFPYILVFSTFVLSLIAHQFLLS
jgi:hypothetical protein